MSSHAHVAPASSRGLLRGAQLLAIVAVAAANSELIAQSNSLFGANQGAAAIGRSTATQPPAAADQMPPLGPGMPYRPLLIDDEEPPPNEVLLHTSLISVQAPKPIKIRVNDIITVIVREDRKTVSDAKMKSEKKWQLDSELKAWLRIDEEGKLVPQVFPKGTPQIGFDYGNKYDTKGKSERKDTLTTRIAAKVIDVKPNGNLIIQAKKRQKVGSEMLVASLTGECSSEDLTPQRTILSTQIYDLNIDMPDEGAVRDATRRGWLMRAMDFLRPF